VELPSPFGHYLLLKRLATTQTGDVFLARPLRESMSVPTPVVIKRLRPEYAEQPRTALRFRHEAWLASLIDNVHVAKLYDAGSVGGTLYTATEFIAGWPLDRLGTYLRDARVFPSLRSVAKIALDILEGLHAIHTAADPGGRPLFVVHRDISPKNLILGEDRLSRIIDLGIGKSLAQEWHTQTGNIVGTPGYLAPEQVRATAVDGRTDLYALGIVVWELLTLEHYIARTSLTSMLEASLAPPFRPPSHLRADVTPQLDDMLERCLRHAPDDRFPSAQEMSAALRSAVPHKDDDEPLRTLVGELLWSEADAVRTEVASLTRTALPVSQTEIEPTVVFVSRSPVAPPTASEPPPLSPRPTRSRAIIAVASAALLVCLLLGVRLGVRIEEDLRPNALETTSAPAPHAELRVVPAPPSSQQEATDARDTAAMQEESSPRKRQRARPLRDPAPERPSPEETRSTPATAEDPHAYVTHLTERAVQLRRQLTDAKEIENMDRILVELSLIAGAPDVHKAKAIEAQLDVVDRTH
jgi:serine/threonine-protein kinase